MFYCGGGYSRQRVVAGVYPLQRGAAPPLATDTQDVFIAQSHKGFGPIPRPRRLTTSKQLLSILYRSVVASPPGTRLRPRNGPSPLPGAAHPVGYASNVV
jgi:hypothetical protein